MSTQQQSVPPTTHTPRQSARGIVVTGVIWALAFVLAQATVATSIALMTNGLAWLAFAVFAVALGIHVMRWRGFLVFAVLGYVVVLALEILSVATGVPFGFFSHHMAGPRLLDVPLFVPVAYVVFGIPAWLIARLLTGGIAGPLTRLQRFATPLAATFILAGWDVHYDAISSTVEGRSSYGDPSGFMGVPLTNFIGWLVTGWVFFQIWALIERRWTGGQIVQTRAVGLWAGAAWALLPLEVLAGYFAAAEGVVEVGGRVFVISDVYEASFIAGILSMTTVGILAVIHALNTPAVVTWSDGDNIERK